MPTINLRHTVRNIVSLLSVVGFAPRPQRPQGLSVIIRVKDEETWLELSIKSIIEVADEVIIGDNGSADRSSEIIRKIKSESPEKISLLSCPDEDIKSLTNILISNTHFNWIIRWDADFVANTNGEDSISRLKEWLFQLKSRHHYLVYPSMIEVCGDLFHQRTETPVRSDCHCFTYSNQLRYVFDREGYEAPIVPKWYRVRRYESPTFFHVDVKPVNRMFLSYLWKRFLYFSKNTSGSSFEVFMEKTLREEWAGQSFEEASSTWALSLFEKLVPYDKERFGEYPDLLQYHINNPQYRLQYSEGTITGRREY